MGVHPTHQRERVQATPHTRPKQPRASHEHTHTHTETTRADANTQEQVTRLTVKRVSCSATSSQQTGKPSMPGKPIKPSKPSKPSKPTTLGKPGRPRRPRTPWAKQANQAIRPSDPSNPTAPLTVNGGLSQTSASTSTCSKQHGRRRHTRARSLTSRTYMACASDGQATSRTRGLRGYSHSSPRLRRQQRGQPCSPTRGVSSQPAAQARARPK